MWPLIENCSHTCKGIPNILLWHSNSCSRTLTINMYMRKYYLYKIVVLSIIIKLWKQLNVLLWNIGQMSYCKCILEMLLSLKTTSRGKSIFYAYFVTGLPPNISWRLDGVGGRRRVIKEDKENFSTIGRQLMYAQLRTVWKHWKGNEENLAK